MHDSAGTVFRFLRCSCLCQSPLPLRFSAAGAGNDLRGALGHVLPEEWFRPRVDTGPSGLRDWPRPFVLRISAIPETVPAQTLLRLSGPSLRSPIARANGSRAAAHFPNGPRPRPDPLSPAAPVGGGCDAVGVAERGPTRDRGGVCDSYRIEGAGAGRAAFVRRARRARPGPRGSPKRGLWRRCAALGLRWPSRTGEAGGNRPLVGTPTGDHTPQHSHLATAFARWFSWKGSLPRAGRRVSSAAQRRRTYWRRAHTVWGLGELRLTEPSRG